MKNTLKLFIATAFVFAAFQATTLYAKKGGGKAGGKSVAKKTVGSKGKTATKNQASKSAAKSRAQSAQSNSRKTAGTKAAAVDARKDRMATRMTSRNNHVTARRTHRAQEVIHNRVFGRLRLTATQRAKLKGALAKAKQFREAFKQKHKARIEQLKAALKAAHDKGDDLKAGKVKAEIKKLVDTCRKQLHGQLKGILSPEQMKDLEVIKKEETARIGDEIDLEAFDVVSIFDF